MRKKEEPEPYMVGDKWYLGDKALDCHSCKYYAGKDEIETDDAYTAGCNYCSCHRFKFKLDEAPGSDYSICEHFTYKGSNAGRGLVDKIILGLILIYLLYIIFLRDLFLRNYFT